MPVIPQYLYGYGYYYPIPIYYITNPNPRAPPNQVPPSPPLTNGWEAVSKKPAKDQVANSWQSISQAPPPAPPSHNSPWETLSAKPAAATDNLNHGWAALSANDDSSSWSHTATVGKNDGWAAISRNGSSKVQEGEKGSNSKAKRDPWSSRRVYIHQEFEVGTTGARVRMSSRRRMADSGSGWPEDQGGVEEYAWMGCSRR